MKEMPFNLNIFQSGALREIDKAILDGDKKFVVVMPTGTGKTYLVAEWFKKELKKNPHAKLLYLCHNQDILTQANDKEFTNHLRDLNISRGYYNASEKSNAQLTFATVQTLYKNLTKFPLDYFDYIIVDEAHHYRAKTFEKTVKHFTPKLLIGLTATPKRMDNKSILKIFDKIIYTAKISTGIKEGLLSKIKYYCVDNDIDFSDIEWNGNNYNETDLNKKLCVPEYDNAVLKEYIGAVKGTHIKTKTICFCATVEHAYRLEKLFNKNNIKSVALTGKYHTDTTRVTLHDNKRAQIIADFKNGTYDIIFVRDLFNEGVDIPDADCVMLLRPTQSDTIFTQQIGRGLRVSPDKNYLLVLDFSGNCYNCLINLDVLGKMVDIDITKKVIDGIDGGFGSPKEFIIYNLGCEVRLSKKKIDAIKGFEHGLVTKEKLIENYNHVKKSLGRQPTAKDMDCEPSQHFSTTYRHHFGSWNKFLLEINEPVNMVQNTNISKEKLIENYNKVKESLKHQPTTKDMDNREISQYGNSAYFRHFGSWNKFLIEIGEPLNSDQDITKEKLIENYNKVKESLKQQPTSTELNNHETSLYSLGTYKKYFGSWNKFLTEIGEPLNNKLTKEKLIENYHNVKKSLKHQPISKDMDKREISQYCQTTYRNYFGSWKKFLTEIGELK